MKKQRNLLWGLSIRLKKSRPKMELALFGKGREQAILMRKRKNVPFQVSAPQARQVYLSGTFNFWDARTLPMKRDEKGVWRTEITLSSGRYEYKFIVDGQWQNDPANTQTVANTFGTHNSVIQVVI